MYCSASKSACFNVIQYRAKLSEESTGIVGQRSNNRCMMDSNTRKITNHIYSFFLSGWSPCRYQQPEVDQTPKSFPGRWCLNSASALGLFPEPRGICRSAGEQSSARVISRLLVRSTCSQHFVLPAMLVNSWRHLNQAVPPERLPATDDSGNQRLVLKHILLLDKSRGSRGTC